MDEVDILLDSISDKIMETGLLTDCIEDGSLATVSLSLSGDKDYWELFINVIVDDRTSDALDVDEEESISDTVSGYFQDSKLLKEFEKLGYKTFAGFEAKLVE